MTNQEYWNMKLKAYYTVNDYVKAYSDNVKTCTKCPAYKKWGYKATDMCEQENLGKNCPEIWAKWLIKAKE